MREDEDGDSGAHLHGATSARRVVGDLVTHNYDTISECSKEDADDMELTLHDVVAIGDKAQ